MKFDRRLFILLLPFLSANLFAGELEALIKEYAQFKHDIGVVYGISQVAFVATNLALQPSPSVREANSFCPLTQASCQFAAFCAFEKALEEAIGNIGSLALRCDLNALALRLDQLGKENNPHEKKWPASKEELQVELEKYQEIMSAPYQMLENIFKEQNALLDRERIGVLSFVQELLKSGQLNEEVDNHLQDLFTQKDEIERDISSLELKISRLANRHERNLEQAKKLDKQLGTLRKLMKTKEEEIIVLSNKVRLLEENHEHQRKSFDELMAKEKISFAEEQAALRNSMDAEAKELERDMEERRKEYDAQKQSLKSKLAKRKQEVENYKVTLSKMIEQTFPKLDKRIEFYNMRAGNPLHESLKTSITDLIETQQNLFDNPAYPSKELGEEKAAQYKLFIRFSNFREKSGWRSKDWFEVMVSIKTRVFFQNSWEDEESRGITIEFDSDGQIKSPKFMQSLSLLIFNRIPMLKKKVYRKAKSIEKQRELREMGEAALQVNPVSALMEENTYPELMMPSAPHLSYEPGQEGRPPLLLNQVEGKGDGGDV